MATPNMNLVLPIPNVTSGTWGDMLNAAIDMVDAHDHATGRGVDVLSPRRIYLHNDNDYGFSSGTALLRLQGPVDSVTPSVAGDYQGIRFSTNDDQGSLTEFVEIKGEVVNPTYATLAGRLKVEVARPSAPAGSGVDAWLTFSGEDCSVRIFDAGVERANLTAYDLFFSSMGDQLADQTLARIIAVRAFTIPINCAESRGSVGTLPSAPATLLLKRNGVTAVTIGITVGGVFSFTNAAPVSVVAGDILTLVAQPVPDATMADIALTVVGAL